MRALGLAARPLVVLLLASLTPSASSAAWEPEGVDLSRPRLLFRGHELPGIQAKLDQDPLPEPLARALDGLAARIAHGESVDPVDHAIDSERFKARAAKNLAFLYAVDRDWVQGEVVPFASPAAREAVGDRARTLLLHLYPRSRLAVPPPLGGSDRDISSSEELIQYATAYDALLGAGYDFGSDEDAIALGIADLASELYENYLHPETAGHYALIHQNNHRTKTGAALAMAAIALAEYTPAPGSDPQDLREPLRWLEYGLDQLDLVWRHVLVSGDGAYGEGPFYWRFTAQNLLPFARAWDRLVGDRDWPARDGVMVPSPWRHPLFRRSQRWMSDMTFADGALVHIDDGNPGRSYYFGAVPLDDSEAAHYAWRWAHAPSAYETDGNIDLAADSIVNHDPALVPTAPSRSPTAFYHEGGNAILKSDWGEDAVVAVVLGEYDTASEFGTDRAGRGVGPQSHEHADPGSFILHAFGERLALDPGYISFGERMRVNQPAHHNVILVDGRGPVSYLGASVVFEGTEPPGRNIADGHSRLSHTLDASFADAVRVTTSYGLGSPGLRHMQPLIERRFLFPDHAYLVVADRVRSRSGGSHELSWLLHGDGGGTADGTFDPQPRGGRWTRNRARLDVALAFDAGTPSLATSLADHEEPGKLERTHVVLRSSLVAETVRSMQLVYPSRTAGAAPEIDALELAGAAALTLDDLAGDRRVLAWHREQAGTTLLVPGSEGGLADTSSDGELALFDAHADGRLRLAWAEEATRLGYGAATFLEGGPPGLLAIAPGVDRADLVVDNGAVRVTVGGLDFEPTTVDGACALDTSGPVPAVALGRERRFTLRAAAGNARPAADPGPDRRVLPGGVVVLDGSRSCDADGDALAPTWELVSAPARGAWQLDDASSWRPSLVVDEPGPYRVQLSVEDAHGARSLPVEVLVLAGLPCQDGIDDDLDGWIDADDRSCGAGVVERSTCDNGRDDDGDGLVDFPEDPGCAGFHQLSETEPACGLGFEVAPWLVAILLRRRSPTRASPSGSLCGGSRTVSGRLPTAPSRRR